MIVKLAGLVGGAEHNGKLAFMLRALPQKERFELELIESGKRMDVRPANFVSFRLPEGTQVVTGAPQTGGSSLFLTALGIFLPPILLPYDSNSGV